MKYRIRPAVNANPEPLSPPAAARRRRRRVLRRCRRVSSACGDDIGKRRFLGRWVGRWVPWRHGDLAGPYLAFRLPAVVRLFPGHADGAVQRLCVQLLCPAGCDSPRCRRGSVWSGTRNLLVTGVLLEGLTRCWMGEHAVGRVNNILTL